MGIEEPIEQCYEKDILTGCWVWQRTLSEGYGQKLFKGKVMGAHRIMWQVNRGPIPEGMCVLHKCDNRACVRPSHLFLGSKKDNAQDAIKKGRAPQLSKRECCSHGHNFTPENTYTYPNGDRECRKCRQLRWQHYDSKR